jgi:hypothetical protein
MAVTIAWTPASSPQAPAGGDVEDVAVEFLAFDGTATDTYDVEATATEHPIETGADITDHVRPMPARITLDVIMTKTPHPDVADADDEHRAETARATVRRLISEGVEVEVTTDVGAWASMLLLTCSESRTADSGAGFRAQITAREIRRVAVQTITAPSPRVERARRRGDRGTQTGEAADPAAPVARSPSSRSRALGLIDATQQLLSGGGS